MQNTEVEEKEETEVWRRKQGDRIFLSLCVWICMWIPILWINTIAFDVFNQQNLTINFFQFFINYFFFFLLKSFSSRFELIFNLFDSNRFIEEIFVFILWNNLDRGLSFLFIDEMVCFCQLIMPVLMTVYNVVVLSQPTRKNATPQISLVIIYKCGSYKNRHRSKSISFRCICVQNRCTAFGSISTFGSG